MFFVKNQKGGLKRWHLFAFLIIVIAFVGLKLSDWMYFPKGAIILGGQKFSVLVADTPNRLYRGLGDRRDLSQYAGMWFVFFNRDFHGIVMRDMRFSIDVVWLDDGVIVDIARNLPLEKNKSDSQLVPYYPGKPATNVLELPAGAADRYGLKIGDRIEFAR